MSDEMTTGQDTTQKKGWIPSATTKPRVNRAGKKSSYTDMAKSRLMRRCKGADKKVLRLIGNNKALYRPISEHKIKVIEALYAQIANEQNIEEQEVRRFAEYWLEIPDLEKMPSFQYREAVKFLADIRLDMVFFNLKNACRD